MVLISFEHQFILLKSIKTASTSVEAFFAATLAGIPMMSEHSREVFDSSLYCSERAPHRLQPNHILVPHESISRVHEVFPEAKKYRVLVCVRNPYERMVSYFWYRLKTRSKSYPYLKSSPALIQKVAISIWCRLFNRFPSNFRLEELVGAWPDLVVIRYEDLEDSLANALRQLGIEEPVQLPLLKSEISPRGRASAESQIFWWARRRVISFLKFEFTAFGYETRTRAG